MWRKRSVLGGGFVGQLPILGGEIRAARFMMVHVREKTEPAGVHGLGQNGSHSRFTGHALRRTQLW